MGESRPANDPSRLLRYRDSIYASDLLLCAVAHLDLFSFLKHAPRTFDEICGGLKVAPRPTDVMLSLLLALELIEKDGERFGLTDVSKAYLVSDSAESLVPYYASLANRPQCLEFREIFRTGKPAGWSSEKDGSEWTEAMRDPQFAHAFTAAMDSRGSYLAQRLAERLDLSRYRSLLDVAGGSGVYACAIARRHEHLRATVLELPPVDDAARRSIDAKGMSGRVDVAAGDMFARLPGGHDVHLFANALHDWDRGSVRKLVANSFESLAAGGRIAVFDAHLDEAKDGPLSIAEYSCLLMHATEGRCYSTKEIADLLRDAGFGEARVLDVAADRSVISADKS
jgi:predicted nicotinamide N-methyase